MWTCEFKGKPEPKNLLTVDHVNPLRIRGKGGSTKCVPCCLECNQIKGQLTIEKFRAIMAVRKAKLRVNFPFAGERLGGTSISYGTL